MGSKHQHPNRFSFIEERLSSIQNNELYRHLRSVIVNGPTAIVDGRCMIHLCSNDYLGLSQNRQVLKKTKGSLKEVSQCSSRLIAGNHPRIVELERVLAEHRSTESALLYPTGYSANLGVITAVADRNSIIFSDELNHASIIDACRLSGAAIRIFRHNDTDHLEELIKKYDDVNNENNDSNGGICKRKVIVTEGVFSMDGDVAKLREISAIAKDHDAITIVDDAHGDFILGPTFSGVPSMFGVNDDIDVHVSSLSKGLGCFGGYVATTEPLIELLINTSRQFIYTSALPHHLCSAAIAAVPLAKKGNLQKKLRRNIDYFSTKIKKLGFLFGNSSSHIIPIIVGQERLSVEFSKELMNLGVFAQAIRYPTVKKGAARLRVSLTAMHTKEHLDAAICAFEKAGRKTKII